VEDFLPPSGEPSRDETIWKLGKKKNSIRLDFVWKKFILHPSTIAEVRIFPLNSKTGHIQPRTIKNRAKYPLGGKDGGFG